MHTTRVCMSSWPTCKWNSPSWWVPTPWRSSVEGLWLRLSPRTPFLGEVWKVLFSSRRSISSMLSSYLWGRCVRGGRKGVLDDADAGSPVEYLSSVREFSNNNNMDIPSVDLILIEVKVRFTTPLARTRRRVRFCGIARAVLAR